MASITYQVYDAAAVGASIQFSILIGFSALVTTLSLSVLWRVVRRTGRFWSSEENGIVKINVAMVAQFLLGILSICQIVSLSAYLNSTYSLSENFSLQFSSPLILYLALLLLVHSTLMQTRYDPLLKPFPHNPAPLDGWSMSKLLRLRQQRKQSKRINFVSLFAGFVLLLAPVTATIALCKSWSRLQEVAKGVKEYRKGLEETRSRIGLGLLGLERAKELLAEGKFVKIGEIRAGFWLAMLFIVLAIYLPSSIYVFIILRNRRSRLRISILRLQESESQVDRSTLSEVASKRENESTNKLVELKERLLKTDRGIKKLLFQLAVVILWITSYLALAAYSMRSFQPESSFLINSTLWSTWSNVLLSLLVSVVFAFRTFFSRLPVLHPRTSPLSQALPVQINGSSSTRRLTTSDFGTRSTVDSNYSSYFPSSYNSRNGSFSTNSRVPPYNPIDTIRSSYPPTPLERKKSQATLNTIKRKAPPVTNDGNDHEDGKSSTQGSVWKEEL